MVIATAISAKVKDVGGFNVRRALPAAQRRAVGPFVFLDQMGPARIEVGQGLDVRPHPHIGLSTMTYLYEGQIQHRDSLGVVQVIEPGAVNWMVAGRGIVHSERSPAEARRHPQSLFGIQFWVALPRHLEEVAPSFLHLAADDLPRSEDRGVGVNVVAGRLFGLESPLAAPHPMVCADLRFAANAATAIPSAWPERALYVAAGRIELDHAAFSEGELIVLEPHCEAAIRALEPARVMLLGGEPLDGPRHLWWNFVSSSKERIEQAKEDWRMGRFDPVPGETEFIPLPD